MCGVAGEATWGGEKSRQAEQDEYDGSEFMTGGGPAGMQGAQCKQMWTSSNRNISIILYIDQLLHNYVPKIKVSFQNTYEKKIKLEYEPGILHFWFIWIYRKSLYTFKKYVKTEFRVTENN